VIMFIDTDARRAQIVMFIGVFYVTSKTDVSSTRNSSGSLESSDHPTCSRQLTVLASFSPAPAKIPTSSSERPRKMRKSRVKTQGSVVMLISIAAAILLGERKRYAMFLCAAKKCHVVIYKIRACMQRKSKLIKDIH